MKKAIIILSLIFITFLFIGCTQTEYKDTLNYDESIYSEPAVASRISTLCRMIIRNEINDCIDERISLNMESENCENIILSRYTSKFDNDIDYCADFAGMKITEVK